MVTNTTKKGFTLVELLVYGVGLVIILGIIAGLTYRMYGIYRDLTVPPRADRVGITLVDRIVRDIRSGQSINLSQSAFNSPTGSLSVTSLVNGSQVVKQFGLQNGRATYQENSGAITYLSPDDMDVSRFYFTQIVTPITQAVRVELQITYDTGEGSKTRTYSGVSILRNSYE